MKFNPFYNFDPYDFLMEIDQSNKTLKEKYQLTLRNTKELAIAFNNQVKRIGALEKRIDTLEEILWRKSDTNEEKAIKEYISALRPARK